MKLKPVITLIAGLTCGVTSMAFAAAGDLYIYPTRDQDEAQQEKDRYECFVWASQETGFNPANAGPVSESKLVRVPVAKNPDQNAVAVGAILGAIVGVAIDDSSRGAAIGAGVGTVAGAAVRAEGQRQVEAEATEEAEQQLAENQALLQQAQSYRRAFAACMEGRDYVVR